MARNLEKENEENREKEGRKQKAQERLPNKS